MLVSIIIPIYNVEDYLAEALDSVCNQTYKQLEIIVVDDGSTDRSGEICDEYAKKDDRIVVIHQINKGLSGARNTGLDMMTGDVVAFLDSDDAYHKDFVKQTLAAMLHNHADIVISKAVNCQTTGKLSFDNGEGYFPSIEEGVYNRIEILQALIDCRINTAVWNKLYNKKLWEKVRFPEGHVFEDLAIIYKIFDLCQAIYVINQPLYIYRIRSGSITETSNIEKIRDRILAWSHVDSYIEENTPKVFTKEQYSRQRRKFLDLMIRQYPKLYCFDQFEDSASFIEMLRTKIERIGNELGTQSYPIITRVTYWMILSCPWLIKIVYPGRIIIRKLKHLRLD